MKKARTYRLEEDVLNKLDELVDFYTNQKTRGISKKVSYADVIEHLVNEKCLRLFPNKYSK